MVSVYENLTDYQKTAMSWLCDGIGRQVYEIYFEDGLYKIQSEYWPPYTGKDLLEFLINLYQTVHLNQLLKDQILIQKCRYLWKWDNTPFLDALTFHCGEVCGETCTDRSVLKWLVEHAALTELAVNEN